MSDGIIVTMTRRRGGIGIAAGKRLGPLLKERGIGVNELDRAVGQKSGYTTRLVRGKKPVPDTDIIRRMAEYLHVSFFWLAFGQGPRDAAAPPDTSTEQQLLEASLSGSVPIEVVRQVDPWQRAVDFADHEISSAAIALARKRVEGRELSWRACFAEMLKAQKEVTQKAERAARALERQKHKSPRRRVGT